MRNKHQLGIYWALYLKCESFPSLRCTTFKVLESRRNKNLGFILVYCTTSLMLVLKKLNYRCMQIVIDRSFHATLHRRLFRSNDLPFLYNIAPFDHYMKKLNYIALFDQYMDRVTVLNKTLKAIIFKTLFW
jgi:hypothetical protein